MSELKQLEQEIRLELTEHIMPFWLKLQDKKYGGFYGEVNYDLECNKKAPKGGIATARFLWSFSSAYRLMGDKAYLEAADNTYEFLKTFIVDKVYGGVFWLVDYRGHVLDTRKHVYANAFAIYGLSEYYRATGEVEALDMAMDLFELIQSYGYDREHNIYKEEFTRDYRDSKNEMLSENGLIADATTNTHLHVLEAYTNLYKASGDAGVGRALENIVYLFYDKIYKKDTNFLKVFYNKQFEEMLNLQSYGHDIEASWLIDDALTALDNKNMSYKHMVIKVAENIKMTAMAEDGSIYIECEDGNVDETRVWWAQAEAMVGFMNAFALTGDADYKSLVEGLWQFTKSHMIDIRYGGEWFWGLDAHLNPLVMDIAEPWKTCYHNARCCLEMIERIKKINLTYATN